MSEMTLEQALMNIERTMPSIAFSDSWKTIKANLTRTPVQVTDDAIKVLDEHHQALLSAGNFTGEGPWFSNGEEMDIKEEYAQARASLSARLAQPSDEGKQQWDELAAILGAHGDNVDEVFRKAREAMAQPVVADLSDNDELMCCNGVDCGCQGITKGQYRVALLSQLHPQAAQGGAAQEAVVWQIRLTSKHGEVWEECTKKCYEDTIRTGRYYGLPDATKDVEVRQLYTHSAERAGVPDGWQRWDADNPPPAGRYVIWYPNLVDGVEKVWEFRKGEFGDKKRWGYKKGSLVWFNAGGWQADRAPAFYRPLPTYPRGPLSAAPTLAGKEKG